MIKKSLLIALSCFGLCLQDGFAESSPFTAETILPDGIDSTISVNPYTQESGPARKGSMAALINNVALLNRLLEKTKSPQTDQEIEAIVKEMNNHLIPALRAVGVFNFFELNEWIGSGKQSGRVLAAVVYLNLYPNEITPEILTALKKVSRSTSCSYLKQVLKQYDQT